MHELLFYIDSASKTAVTGFTGLSLDACLTAYLSF